MSVNRTARTKALGTPRSWALSGNNLIVAPLSPRMERVVPLAMEVVAGNPEHVHFGIRDLYSSGVLTGIELGGDPAERIVDEVMHAHRYRLAFGLQSQRHRHSLTPTPSLSLGSGGVQSQGGRYGLARERLHEGDQIGLFTAR